VKPIIGHSNKQTKTAISEKTAWTAMQLVHRSCNLANGQHMCHNSRRRSTAASTGADSPAVLVSGTEETDVTVTQPTGDHPRQTFWASTRRISTNWLDTMAWAQVRQILVII